MLMMAQTMDLCVPKMVKSYSCLVNVLFIDCLCSHNARETAFVVNNPYLSLGLLDTLR